MNDCIFDEKLKAEKGVGCPDYLTEKCNENCDRYLSPKMIIKSLIDDGTISINEDGYSINTWRDK